MKAKNFERMNYINALTNDLESIYRQSSKALGVSDSVMRILYAIYEKGDGCLLYDICRYSGLSKQTINSAMRKLENEDILFLKQDKGKTKRVYLTDKGKSLTKETAEILFSAECSAFDNWSSEEIESYLALMKKYNDSLREQINKIIIKNEKGNNE